MEKEVIISDESVNMYGFRVLTDGIDLTAFEKNPVMLYDHVRRDAENSKDIILPIGKWVNLRKEGGKLIGTPEFDIEDVFAKEIARKFSKGYINAASLNAGFDKITWSDDPQYMLPGQTGPTIIECMIREISLTDIPGNYNTVKLHHAGKSISLNGKTDPTELNSFFSKPIKQIDPPMKKIILALNASKLLSLTEASSEELIANSVDTIVARLNANAETLSQKETEITRLTNELATAKNAGRKDKAVTLVEIALSAKKINASQKDSFIAMASASEEGFNTTKDFIDKLVPFESPTVQLRATPGGKTNLELKAEFEKHANEGTLDALKAENPEHFKVVYKAGTGADYKA